MKKDNSHIDPELVDRGWEQMKELLDAEMPTAPPRRRRLAVWFFFVALAGLGCAVWWFYTTQPGQGADDRSFSAMADQQRAKTPAIVQPADLQPGNTQMPAHTAAEPTISTRPQGARQRPRTSPAPTSTDLTETYASNLQVLPTHRDAHQPIVALPASKNPLEAIPMQNRSAAPAHLAPPAISPLQSTPALDWAILESKPPSSAREETKGYLQAGLGANLQPATGFSLQGGKEFPLGDKWALQLGGGYSWIRRQLYVVAKDSYESSSGTFINIDLDYQFGHGDAEFMVFMVSTSSHTNLDFHYLDFHAGMSRRLGSRWQLSLALQPSILLRATPDIANGGIFSRSKASESDPIALSQTDLRVPLQALDCSLLGSVEYRLSRQWALGLHYRFGLVDVLENNGQREYHRLGGLWLRYTLR